MSETNAITTVNHGSVAQSSSGALSLKQIGDRVAIVHQVLERVMKKGTHYGTVPGCGARMVLFKPGADVLAMTFRLVPQFKVDITRIENDHREYDVTCSMYGPDGNMLGQGVGSGSTMEKKYRYVAGAERSDIADVYNTVLKMAKKRALVDATLTVTGAADLFTQDLIDDDADTVSERAPIQSPVARTDGPAESESAEGNIGIVEAVSVKGTKKGTNRYGVKIAGEWYGTFDATIGTTAESLKKRSVSITWKHEGQYKTLLSIVAIEQPPPQTDNASDNVPF
jgi:hypothetical protein